jgi:hypothetical protein
VISVTAVPTAQIGGHAAFPNTFSAVVDFITIRNQKTKKQATEFNSSKQKASFPSGNVVGGRGRDFSVTYVSPHQLTPAKTKNIQLNTKTFDPIVEEKEEKTGISFRSRLGGGCWTKHEKKKAKKLFKEMGNQPAAKRL